MITSRRSFITGLTSLLVAPAIVRVESIMPVKVVDIIDDGFKWPTEVHGYKVGDIIRIRLPDEYWQLLNGGKPREFKIIE